MLTCQTHKGPLCACTQVLHVQNKQRWKPTCRELIPTGIVSAKIFVFATETGKTQLSTEIPSPLEKWKWIHSACRESKYLRDREVTTLMLFTGDGIIFHKTRHTKAFRNNVFVSFDYFNGVN